MSNNYNIFGGHVTTVIGSLLVPVPTSSWSSTSTICELLVYLDIDDATSYEDDLKSPSSGMSIN